MAELSESQLILLDNLIYLKNIANRSNKTVGEAVEDVLDRIKKDKYTDLPASMSKGEWVTILNNIQKDPQLTSLTIKNGNPGYSYDSNGQPIMDQSGQTLEAGMRVATFVDTSGEATVVFRGTGGDYEWYDNGQGGYLPETKQQMLALQYIESLPYDNITVTGHSKGGNKTQFVAIMSDKVDRAVSFDGQGFSKEFLEKYKDRIEANRDKITSISAENDFVNCLLHPIAGTVKYIDTEKQDPFIFNHKPNIVLDEHGQLRGNGEQGKVSQFINEYSTYINENMQDPFRRFTIDGVLGWLQTSKNDDFEGMNLPGKIIATVMALSHLDDFVFHQISEEYGDLAELAVTSIAAFLFPKLFMDDFLHSLTENISNAISFSIEKLKQFGDWLVKKLAEAVEKFKELERQVSLVLIQFVKDVQEGWNRFKGWVADFAEDVKNGAIEAVQAMERFKDKIAKAVTSFFHSIAEGTKKIIKAIGDWWSKAVEKLKNTASAAVNQVKAELAQEYVQFQAGMGLMTELPKKAAESALSQASPAGAPPQYAKSIIRGYGSYSSARLAIDFSRLSDLQLRLKSLEDNFGSTVQKVTSDVQQIISGVGRSYSEPNVQRQIHQVQSSCSRVSQYGKQVTDELDRRARSLKYAGEQYRKVEAMLS